MLKAAATLGGPAFILGESRNNPSLLAYGSSLCSTELEAWSLNA